MKQVALSSDGEVLVLEVPAPVCEDNGVLVEVSHSLISSGTEMMSVTSTDGHHTTNPFVKALHNPDLAIKAVKSIFKNGIKQTFEVAQNVLHSFQATGYSSAGIVKAVGKNVRDIKVGDRVACAGTGYANHAEYNYVPQNLVVPIPSNVSFEQACFVTLGTIAMHGVRQAKVSFGENVLVIGLGLVGQLTAQILKTAGCQVCGVDLLAQRLDLAADIGCKSVVLANDPLYKEKLLSFTDGVGFDAVLLTAGTKSSEPINSVMEFCRDRGRVTVVGDVGMNLVRAPFFKKELEISISRSYGPGRYDPSYEEKGMDYPIGYARWTERRNMAEVIRQISDGQLLVSPLISATYKIDEAPTAYKHIKENSRDTIAVLIDYGHQTKQNTFIHDSKIVTRNTERSPGKIGFAVVGAGEFVKGVHLPNLNKNTEAGLVAIVTRNGLNAKQMAETYKASYCSTDYKEILNDDHVQAVIIGTRHHLRKDLIIDLANARKHIYVEKPLALSYKDCLEIEEAVARNGILLTVGFNRRFAQCAQNAYEVVSRLPGPKIINYRINAGYLPPTHWLYDSTEGGGRIKGEAVHFFDFITWMCGEKPVEVIAKGIVSDDARISRNDNLVITIVYDQGSIGTILYTGMGHSSLSKERIEIFGGNSAIIIDDFKNTYHYGTGAANVELQQVDKGTKEALNRFVQSILGKQNLSVDVRDGTLATWCAEQAIMSLNNPS